MMFSLLDKLGIHPGDVQYWLPTANNTVKEKSPAGRFKLFSEALLPPALSGRWRSVTKKSIPQKDLKGIIIIESDDQRAEAETIALIMRETLEQEARSAALITSDRNLARQVTSAASRWNLNIYDSAGSVGANANFLSRDGNGIRWVSFEPVETEGVFLQDEGTFVPTVGAAQSFTVLNFVQKNSDGRGTDTLIPTAQDPTTVTGVATIFTQDLWGHQGTGIGAAIYRQSRVGINQVNPLYQLDVNGDFHVSAGVQFDATLDVNGSVQFNNTLDVDGITNLKSSLESTNVNSGALVVDGGVGVEKNLNVGGSGVIAVSYTHLTLPTKRIV